jgi:hypothetical protein
MRSCFRSSQFDQSSTLSPCHVGEVRCNQDSAFWNVRGNGSMIMTSNLVFSEWDKIFKDPMTTAAAIDRLVHHSTTPPSWK